MNSVSNLGAYLQRFGLLTGYGLYISTKMRRGIRTIDVPGMTKPIYMRTGTSDRSAFNEVIVKRWYDHPFPGGQPRLIIDAGANVGYASVRFAALYPKADIVAIEPDFENFELLEKNIAAYPQVKAMRCGVWPRSAALVIENPTAKSWAFRVREAHEGESGFPAVALNDLLDGYPSRCIDILKLDVEGAEKELFADDKCHDWLARTKMMFIELHDRIKPGCTEAMERALAPHKFSRLHHGSNLILIRSGGLE
ncbi:MAG: FkbM family methyltransferase [Gammaproteobacteria bacterium]|nr:FkbM family methyltransferase [Gammaproteobacteria bacterium]